MSLNIEVIGKGQPLVFFHGWGFEHHVWHSFAPFLSSDYQLHLVDLPGYGLSSFYSWESFLTEIKRKIPTPFVAIGWSLGGLFATRLAVELPNQISHLINISSSPCFVKKEDWPGIEASVLKELQIRLVEDSSKTLDDFLSLQQKYGEFQYQFSIRPKTEALLLGLQMLETWDLRYHLLNLKTPTCYFFGRNDTIILRDTMSSMQKYFPNLDYLLLEKSAHVPFISEGQIVADAIRLHLQK